MIIVNNCPPNISGGILKKEVKAHTSQRPTKAGAYTGFRSMKHLAVLLLLPGRDAAVCRRYSFIHLGEERQSGVKFLV